MENIDTVSTDVLIIGGGPSGLATAIHLSDILNKKARVAELCFLKREKRSEVIYYRVL